MIVNSCGNYYGFYSCGNYYSFYRVGGKQQIVGCVISNCIVQYCYMYSNGRYMCHSSAKMAYWWCSIVGATVTVHQFFCNLLLSNKPYIMTENILPVLRSSCLSVRSIIMFQIFLLDNKHILG